MEVEVCAYSLESCRAARKAGADRVELCTAMYDGGTTPSAGMIRLARKLLQIELYIMIRPRGGDFLYSAEEYEQMKEDLLFAKASGADGVVVGLLQADGQVDSVRTRELVELAGPMGVTFHRAFDMTKDPFQALEDIITSGCKRILTSGQKNTAGEGTEVLRQIVLQADGRIQIMAGSGINGANALDLVRLGVDALHMSGKSSRNSGMKFRNPDVFMGGVPGLPEYEIVFGDVSKIRNVVCKVKEINGK